MSDAFVEERRASLQKYLQKLAAHPVVGPSEVRPHPSSIVASAQVVMLCMWGHLCGPAATAYGFGCLD